MTGVWSGGTNGTWDNSSTSTSNLNWTGSNNYNIVTGLTNTLYFADTDGFGNNITNNAVTIAAGGVSNNGGTINFINNAVNYTFSSLDATGITGTTALVQSGTGTVTLTGTNSYNGATTVSGGVLQIGNGTTDGSIATSSGITDTASLVYNLVGSQSYANIISGSGGTVTKLGTGTLTFSGANSYTGGTTISAGLLQVGNGGTSGALGTGAVVDNAALLYNQTSTTISNAISGTGTVTNTGNTGGLTIGANIAMTSSGGFNLTTSNAATINTGVSLSVASGSGIVNATTTSGIFGLTFAGTGTLTAGTGGSITIIGSSQGGGGPGGINLSGSTATHHRVASILGLSTAPRPANGALNSVTLAITPFTPPAAPPR